MFAEILNAVDPYRAARLDVETALDDPAHAFSADGLATLTQLLDGSSLRVTAEDYDATAARWRRAWAELRRAAPPATDEG